MILSNETIAILKNFSNINKSIEIKPGNEITTISPMKTILAKANVEETFEQTFAIFELSKFLGCLSLFSQPDIIFYEKYLTIAQGVHKVRYTYCEPANIITPPVGKKLPMNGEIVSFDLPMHILPSILKSVGILGLPEIRIYGDGKDLYIMGANSKNLSSDEYSIKLCECSTDLNFYFNRENILMMNDRDYVVRLTSQGVVEMSAHNLQYYVVGEAK